MWALHREFLRIPFAEKCACVTDWCTMPLPNKAELFELIVESSKDFAIFTQDETGLVTSWNIGAERLFGYSESDMLGTSADVIFTPEDRAAGAPEHERVVTRTQ